MILEILLVMTWDFRKVFEKIENALPRLGLRLDLAELIWNEGMKNWHY